MDDTVRGHGYRCSRGDDAGITRNQLCDLCRTANRRASRLDGGKSWCDDAVSDAFFACGAVHFPVKGEPVAGECNAGRASGESGDVGGSGSDTCDLDVFAGDGTYEELFDLLESCADCCDRRIFPDETKVVDPENNSARGDSRTFDWVDF